VDVVRFCPGCGRGDPAFVQEYWVAADRHVVCWCAGCGLMCTVVLGALVGTEPEH
jgi:hypothetical protein